MYSKAKSWYKKLKTFAFSQRISVKQVFYVCDRLLAVDKTAHNDEVYEKNVTIDGETIKWRKHILAALMAAMCAINPKNMNLDEKCLQY